MAQSKVRCEKRMANLNAAQENSPSQPRLSHRTALGCVQKIFCGFYLHTRPPGSDIYTIFALSSV